MVFVIQTVHNKNGVFDNYKKLQMQLNVTRVANLGLIKLIKFCLFENKANLFSDLFATKISGINMSLELGKLTPLIDCLCNSLFSKSPCLSWHLRDILKQCYVRCSSKRDIYAHKCSLLFAH